MKFPPAFSALDNSSSSSTFTPPRPSSGCASDPLPAAGRGGDIYRSLSALGVDSDGNEELTRESALDAVFDAASRTGGAEAESVFFSVLEPRVLDGHLTRLGPAVVQRLVALYEAQARLEQLEAWLVRLEIQCLDFDQVRGYVWLKLAVMFFVLLF